MWWFGKGKDEQITDLKERIDMLETEILRQDRELVNQRQEIEEQYETEDRLHQQIFDMSKDMLELQEQAKQKVVQEVEVIKEVAVPVIQEVVKEVEIVKEVIREIEVPVIEEVIREVEIVKEIVQEVEVESQESIDERELQESVIDNMSNKIVELRLQLRALKVAEEFENAEEMGNKIKSLESQVKLYEDRIEMMKQDMANIKKRASYNRDELTDVAMFMDDIDLFVEEKDTDKYIKRLEDNIARQESLVEDGKACICPITWTVGNSKAKGQQMTKNNIKLAIRMFNLTCNQLIMKIGTRTNLNTVLKRIESEFNTINRLNKHTQVELTQEFLELKKQQATMVYQQMRLRQAIREREAEERRILKEQEKLEAEIAKEKEKLLKEKATYLREQQRLMKQKKQTEELQARIAELESYIQQLDTQAEELDERASVKCRAGWCYVISNPSMPNYVKIGVTRRIDPNVRIQELSTASVPFKMDTHATIFAQDAFELESLLHRHFNDKRVNKVNFHKEWFEVSVDEIESFILDEVDSTVQFEHNPYNEEYEETLRIIESQSE